jgi:ABC-2 type transport system permease protein
MSDGGALSATGSRPAHTDRWVHHSRAGIEVGGLRPTGKIDSVGAAFLSSVSSAWELRKALWVLVLKDFKGRYRAHALGLFWSLAHPLVMMATMTVAFRYIMRIQIKNFAVFYLIGAIYWQFFSNAITSGGNSLMDNGGAVKTTTFPRFLFPVAAVLSQLIHFAMENVLIVLFFFFFPSAYNFNGTIVLLPVLVVVLLMLVIGLSLMLAPIHPRYRDLQYIVSSVLTVGFWLTPILYSTSMAPPQLRPILRLNPIGGIIESAREIIMRGRLPSGVYLLPAVAIAIVVFIVGCAVFRRQNVRVADYV